MVFLTRICSAAKNINKPRKIPRFVDDMRLYCRGGGGGSGQPKYGGYGGRGGHVYMKGTEKATLRELWQANPQKRFVAPSGEHSRLRALLGAPGADLEIEVPVGVSVFAERAFLGEINEADERVLVALGGRGGCPQNSFQGERGTAVNVRLDLKLIADIGLVGFPNAGKSTLLSVLSRAKPKIANYPFTTLTPQLGTMMYEDGRRISMADLPGLIEGAHCNYGMGHQFLKHVERTKMLLFMVDIHGFQLRHDREYRSAYDTIVLLCQELELYKSELMEKPAILVLNKTDMEGSEAKVQEITEQLQEAEGDADEGGESESTTPYIKFDEVISISAKDKTNTDYLKTRLRLLLDVYADREFEKTHQKDTSVERQLTEHHRGSQLV